MLGHEFYYDQNKYKVDYVYDHQESLSLMDNFRHKRGLCGGTSLEVPDSDLSKKLDHLRNYNFAVQILKGVPSKFKYKIGTCNIVCEYPWDNLNEAVEGHEKKEKVEEKIDKIKKRDSQICEISIDKASFYADSELGYSPKLYRLTSLIYHNKLYARQFVGYEGDRSKVGNPWGGYFLPDYKHDNIDRSFCNNITIPVSITMPGGPNSTVLGGLDDGEGNDIRNKWDNHPYMAMYKPVDPAKVSFKNTCMRVCNITQSSDLPKGVRHHFRRVGYEYLKLQKFFGGLKASLYKKSIITGQINSFIEDIEKSREKFSTWNPGVFDPKVFGPKKEFEDQAEGDVKSHDFLVPIQSLELIDASGNSGNFKASIREKDESENECVIKALNRYIHNSKSSEQESSVLRLMIQPLHFEEDSCDEKGKSYLNALKALKISNRDVDDKDNDKIIIEYKYKVENPS
ncbi:MAG: hypothetical protein OXC44_05520 [Proteobacteria bacterium]|nr:hypothetical protein [Pseudomonadota bacterium]